MIEKEIQKMWRKWRTKINGRKRDLRKESSVGNVYLVML
jgi:hypothetical protein